MANVTLMIPDEVESRLAAEREDIGTRIRLAAAFSLCSRGELSTSLAARLAGLSYSEFLEAAAQAQVELFPVDFEELEEEIQRGHTMGRERLASHPPRQNGTS